jgi:hypothetical protein
MFLLLTRRSKLSCTITGHVADRYFNTVQTTTGIKYMPKYAGNDYELRISRIKMEDKGEYIVRATNSYGTREETALLNVERKYLAQ